VKKLGIMLKHFLKKGKDLDEKIIKEIHFKNKFKIF